MIILTDELKKEIIEKDIKCTYYDDYVILNKRTDIRDELFNDYVNRVNQAHNNGINTPYINDYYFIPNTKELGVSKVIIIEEKAKGNVLKVRGPVIYLDKDINYEEVIAKYLNNMNLYLEELEKRSNAKQEVYDKFVNDYLSLEQYGLTPDANSLNFLFDEEVGFTIIDIFNIGEHIDKNHEKLLERIINDVYGVSRPTIFIKGEKVEQFYYLPIEYNNRLKEYSDKINEKIITTFSKLGFSKEYIDNTFNKNKHRFKTDEVVKDNIELLSMLSLKIGKTEVITKDH